MEPVMVICLDEYRKAKASRAAAQECSEEERTCVNCGPAIAIAAGFSYPHPHELSPPLPDDLAAGDRDAFIGRVYALASQI
jgi:hypothetical protein